MTGPAGDARFFGAYSNKLGDLLLSGCRKAPTTSADARIRAASAAPFTYYALKALKSMKPGANYADWHKAIAKYLPSASYPQSPHRRQRQARRALPSARAFQRPAAPRKAGGSRRRQFPAGRLTAPISSANICPSVPLR